MPIPRWRCFFLFGNIRTEPEVNLHKRIIHIQQESSHSVFSRLYEFYLQDVIFFAVSHQYCSEPGGISIFKTLPGIPIRKNADGHRGVRSFTTPQLPVEKSLLSKVDEKVPKWKLEVGNTTNVGLIFELCFMYVYPPEAKHHNGKSTI